MEDGQENWTPYQFGFDNAVRFADADGQAPGDGVWGAITAVVDFTNGFANGMVSNSTTLPNGASLVRRVAPSNMSESLGQTAADVAGIFQGGAEFLAGGTAALGGGAVSLSGVGAVVGVPAMAGGVAVAGHGANTANNAMRNLLNNDNNGRYNADSAPKSSKGTNTLAPGPHANESIPASSPASKFSAEERKQVNRIGKDTGCHTCGTKDPGTKSGNFIPDHQPPSKLMKTGESQRLYPHCQSCGRKQGGDVNASKTRKVQ